MSSDRRPYNIGQGLALEWGRYLKWLNTYGLYSTPETTALYFQSFGFVVDYDGEFSEIVRCKTPSGGQSLEACQEELKAYFNRMIGLYQTALNTVDLYDEEFIDR